MGALTPSSVAALYKRIAQYVRCQIVIDNFLSMYKSIQYIILRSE